MLLTDRAKDRVKKNPTWSLGILLALHLIAVSLNRAPGKPDLSLLQVVLMTITSPFQSGIAHGIGWVKGGWNSYFAIRDSRQENERLRAQLAQLETKNIELREKAIQLDQLNAFTNRQTVYSYPAIHARVVGRDANQLFNSIVIDVGSNNGVVKDQPVVTADGLVGRVIIVTPISARVLLITDERHAAGAIIGQTADSRLLGIVKGKNDYLCEMKFIAAPDKVENGEQVITSGQDRIYPKGLLIGRVKKNNSGSAVAPETLEVEPAAMLGKLETVSVLTIPPEQIRGTIDSVTREEKKQDTTLDQKKRKIEN